MSTTGSILIVGTYIRLRSKLIAGRRFGPEAFRLADPAPPLIPSRYRAGAWGWWPGRSCSWRQGRYAMANRRQRPTVTISWCSDG